MSNEDFEIHRDYLQEIAFGILGSTDEAADAVRETRQRLRDGDRSVEENATAWFTTVMARVCLDVLRSRRGQRMRPGPLYDADPPGPESAIADSIGVVLLAALDQLAPPERLAFVLHDVFSVPMDEIADVVDRSPDATRVLYGKARQRMHQFDIGGGDPELG